MTALFKPSQELAPTFRKAAQRDLRQIMQVFSSSFKGQIPQFLQADYHSYFAEGIRDPRCQFNVAALNNTIVGFTCVESHRIANAAALSAIGVDPSVQGLGIGKTLMQGVEKAAMDFNRPKVQLEVREDNTPAIGFYERIGYHQTGIIPDYYWWDRTSGIVMEKQVATPAQDNVPKLVKQRIIRR